MDRSNRATHKLFGAAYVAFYAQRRSPTNFSTEVKLRSMMVMFPVATASFSPPSPRHALSSVHVGKRSWTRRFVTTLTLDDILWIVHSTLSTFIGPN